MTDQQILFIARNYTTPYQTLEDLMQEGRILCFQHQELPEEQLIKKLNNRFQTLKRKDNKYRSRLLPLSYADNIESREIVNFSFNPLEEMLYMGYTHKEIALQMGVSTKTIQRRIKELRIEFLTK